MPTGEFSSLQNTFQRKTVRETIYNINYDPPNRLKKEPTKSSFFMGEKKLERSHLKSFFFYQEIFQIYAYWGSWYACGLVACGKKANESCLEYYFNVKTLLKIEKVNTTLVCALK